MKERTQNALLALTTKMVALVSDRAATAIPRPVRTVVARPLRRRGSRIVSTLRQRPSTASTFARIFDEDFYTKRYPDVNVNQIDPFLHYLVYGRREARAPLRELDMRFPGPGYFDLPGSHLPSTKPSLLFILHEATVTGAPMLGLEVVRHLCKNFDVYVVFLRGGPLLPEFLRYCITATTPREPDSLALLDKDELAAIPLPNEFAFVVANTVVAGQALTTFDRNSSKGIVTLIHEYPTQEWLHMHDLTVRNSDLVVYSSEFVRDATIEALDSYGIRNSRVFAQGKIPYDAIRTAAPSAKGASDDITLQWHGKKLVVGCGTIDYRKGVDTFISVAERIQTDNEAQDIRFIWLGPPGPDAAYHSLVKMQLAHSVVSPNFTFIRHLDNPSDLIDNASLFLLTSRIDPLPNVAIDALYGGTPVICFEDAGGIPDLVRHLSRIAGKDVGYIVGYAQVSEMATTAVEVLVAGETAHNSGQTLASVQRELATDRYVERLVKTLGEAAERRRHLRAITHNLSSSTLPSAEELVTNWASGTMGKLKPTIGFNPGAAAESTCFESEPVDLLGRALAGVPQGAKPEAARAVLSRTQPLHRAQSRRVGLHIHVYYDDLLDDILTRLAVNATRPDLYISVPSKTVAESVLEITSKRGFAARQIRSFPNRGRDVWPFIEFASDLASDYELFGHVHTKASSHISDRDMVRAWRSFLLDNTIGGKYPTLDLIADRMASDESLAIAFPDDPYAIGWTQNRRIAEELLKQMGWAGPVPHYFDFPVGTMFWATPDLVAVMSKLNLALEDMPTEPIPIDGTVLHAYERILGVAPALLAKSALAVRMPGTSRFQPK